VVLRKFRINYRYWSIYKYWFGWLWLFIKSFKIGIWLDLRRNKDTFLWFRVFRLFNYNDFVFDCVSVSSKFDTAFLPDCTKFFLFFLRLLDRKFNEDSENVLKTVIFLFQVGLTGDFVSDCPFKLCFCQFKD